MVTLTYALSPSIGMVWTLKALIVIVLAGTGSIIGALPAGILLGVVEAMSGVFIASTYREVVGLVIFVLVLLLRPQGLFSRE
jgi:branched-chain amino acid transport system permease protein